MSLSLRKHKSHHYSRPRPRLRSRVITEHGLGLNLFTRKLLDNLSREVEEYITIRFRDAKDEKPEDYIGRFGDLPNVFIPSNRVPLVCEIPR